MNKDYSAMTERVINDIKKCGKKPSLLLHVCCAPCSSYVMEYLSEYFQITLYYYNPNISPQKEYDFRFSELSRLVDEFPAAKGIDIILGEYDPESFIDIAKGLEHLPEGDERCKKCYKLRLEKTALTAKNGNFDYFTTTLSISPYKNAHWLNSIGDELAKNYNIPYLFSDFKKKNGYKRSIQLSKEYGLYRQDFCGCAYSKAEAELRRLENSVK